MIKNAFSSGRRLLITKPLRGRFEKSLGNTELNGNQDCFFIACFDLEEK